MSPRIQYALAVGVAASGAMLAIVLAGAPEEYGLTPVAFKWLGAIAGVLVVLAGVLPKLQEPPTSTRRRRRQADRP